MISFKQLDTGTPPDIEVTTDNANGELADWTDMFNDALAQAIEYEAGKNLAAAEMDSDGWVTFIVPGDEADEIADCLSEELGDFLDECNERAVGE